MLITIAIYLAILVVFSTTLYYGFHAIQNYKQTEAINQLNMLDRALEGYAAAHIGIDESTIHLDAEQRLKYKKIRFYPKKLDDLQQMGAIPGIDTTKFKYSTSSDRTKYKLETTVNEKTLKSKSSNL